jgi:MoaA/NifB/PqqE/SkfB family radical SAM enzyme
MGTVKERVKSYGLNKALRYMDSDYEKNVPKALRWVERLDREGLYRPAYDAIRTVMENKENNWHIFLKNIYADLDPESRRMLLSNFIVNASILNNERRRKVEKRENCNVPWAILMDPTSACNLKCTGCWAAEYGNSFPCLLIRSTGLSVREKRSARISTFIQAGSLSYAGRILLRSAKHRDCVFLAFTNGTLIDDAFADEMKRVHNFIPAISIEGFEEANDSRRGAGTYRRVIAAMERLRTRGLPFGISTCYTSKNTEEVGSDAFIDAMIAQGAKFCWYFTYIPVGCGAPTDLIASDRQREFMYRQVRRFRSEKPMFILDFWNDGEFVGGCIAGGRQYLHINAGGDVEPCAFIHYSNRNIRDHSLLDALKSPLFLEYRKQQPFNDNLLRPCPLLDNIGALAGMVKRSGAHSTDFASPEDVDSLTEKCVPAAEKWAVTAEKLWANSPAGQKCNACRRQASGE